MQLSRDHYEEAFFDYTEGNLSPASRREVERFVQQHPDLEAELLAYADTVLQPDPDIVYARKDLLYKKEQSRSIWLYGRIGMYVAAASMLLFAAFTFLQKSHPSEAPGLALQPPPVIPSPGQQPVFSAPAPGSVASNRQPGTSQVVIVPVQGGDTHAVATHPDNHQDGFPPVVLTASGALQPIALLQQAALTPASLETGNGLVYQAAVLTETSALHHPAYTPSRWLQQAGAVAGDVYRMSGRSTTMAFAAGNSNPSVSGLNLNNISVDLGFLKYFHHGGDNRK